MSSIKTVLTLFIFLEIFAPGSYNQVAAAISPTSVSTPSPAVGEEEPVTSSADISVTPVPKEDITQPTQETKGRLEKIIDEQKLGSLSASNFLRYGISRAVTAGVPANTIVLLLLFPLVAAVIAAARHLLGLRGFGIFTPAITSVAFLATGLELGITLFVATVIIASLARYLTRRLKLQYLPRMSFLIWFMTLGILAAILTAPAFGSPWPLTIINRLTKVGIFPILLMILLTETFISAQISHGPKVAVQMTVETLFLATISYLIMDLKVTQGWVLTHPELTITALAGINIAIGKFTGLRALEMWRFRDLLRK